MRKAKRQFTLRWVTHPVYGLAISSTEERRLGPIRSFYGTDVYYITHWIKIRCVVRAWWRR